jgi:hypothetical protein
MPEERMRCRLTGQRKIMFAVLLLSVCGAVVGWAPFLQESAIRTPLLLLCVFAIWGLLCFWLFIFLRRALAGRTLGRRALMFLGLLLIVGGLFTVSSDLLGRRLPIFQEAKRDLENSTVAKRDLGEPISIGWPVSYDWEAPGGIQKVRLTMPVSGGRGKGSFCVVGTKSNGSWMIDHTYLILNGSKVWQELKASESNVKTSQ